MSHHTIFVTDPDPTLAPQLRANCAGQHIGFDGKCSRGMATATAHLFLKHARKVQVFAGRELGRLVLELDRNQQPTEGPRDYVSPGAGYRAPLLNPVVLKIVDR